MLTRDQLQRAAASSGFPVDSLEKVWMLVRLLNMMMAHPFMGPRVALKGGTALNLFVFDVPRLSVDIDINYIRLYALEKPANSPPGPGLDTSPPEVSPRPRLVRSTEEEEALAPLKDVLMSMAVGQEMNYAEHYSYTASVSQIFSNSRQRLPDGVEVNILFASGEGWMGTVTDSESGDYCALAYGFFIPMGWTPGMIICP